MPTEPNHMGARMGAILAEHDERGPEYAFVNCTAADCHHTARVDDSASLTDAQIEKTLENRGWSFRPTRCPDHEEVRMPEWTPSMGDLEEGYIERAERVCGTSRLTAGTEFDRAIAAHDAEVRAPLEAEHRAKIAALVDEGTRQKRRAIAAEAKVRAVEALADDMDERGRPGEHDSPTDIASRRQIREDVKRLRAALANPTPEELS